MGGNVIFNGKSHCCNGTLTNVFFYIADNKEYLTKWQIIFKYVNSALPLLQCLKFSFKLANISRSCARKYKRVPFISIHSVLFLLQQVPSYLHMASSKMWCGSGWRGILTKLSLCYLLYYDLLQDQHVSVWCFPYEDIEMWPTFQRDCSAYARTLLHFNLLNLSPCIHATHIPLSSVVHVYLC